MQSKENKKKIQLSKYMVYIVFVIVFIFFAIILNSKGFVNPTNLLNILRQTAMVSIMAVAGVFVLGAGQIDLTVGSNAAMSAMIASLILQEVGGFLGIILALLACLAFGIGIGCINGLLVTRLRLPAEAPSNHLTDE